jgi:signal transduction histidine kinase
LILLDVMMPIMDGFEVCQQLKANPLTQDIPVIFMTALSDTESKTKAFELGAVDYITKPFQEAEVLARVKTHLQLRYLTKNLEQQVCQRTSELNQALQALQSSQLQLVQSEKMSGLGSLVAGIAHEINNPLGFVCGNVNHVEEYMKDLLGLIDLYQECYPQPTNDIQAELEAIELEYLREDLPKLIHSTQEGIKRITNISTSLRTFSRADSDRPIPFNLHEGIDSTLLILKHRLRANDTHPEIIVITNYGEIPLVECFAGQLNQVFMNILANAIDTIDECLLKEIKKNGEIHIRTEVLNGAVVIRIKDNGMGMPPEVKGRIFDYLFTTKEIGKGTGLGLAIAHQIVTEKHNGSIKVNSTIGQGTEFIITIPIKSQVANEINNPVRFLNGSINNANRL